VGCSTLEISDEYVLKGTKSASVTYSGDGIDVEVHVSPDDRFTSIGLLGVPAIPVYARTKAMGTINLEVVITLRTNHSFSFSPMPCLSTAAAQGLCPTGVLIEAKAMSADAGETLYNGARRWGHIAQFYDPPFTPPLRLPLPRSPVGARITADEIYRHYSYRQVPPWTFLEARLNYHYTCTSPCPTEFTIDLTDIAIIDTALRTTGTYTYHRERKRDYNATREIQ
jgi:hypothetical protein